MSYPIPVESGGTGLVVSGYRIVAPGYSDGYRFTAAGQTYELFVDVSLRSVSSNGYVYDYLYWYRPVEFTLGRWQPLPNSPRRQATVSGGQVTSLLGQTPSLTLQTQSAFLPGQTSGSNPTPISFGWSGSGNGTIAGSPNVGPGGAALSATGSSIVLARNVRTSQLDGGGGGGGGDDPDDPDNPDDNPSLWWEPENPLDTGGTSPDETAETWTPPDSGGAEARKTYWNPPLISLASGAYVPVRYSGLRGTSGVQFKEPPTRVSLLGSGDYAARIGRKGYIIQDLREQWADRWKSSGNSGDTEEDTEDEPAPDEDAAAPDDAEPEDAPADNPAPDGDGPAGGPGADVVSTIGGYDWAPGAGVRYGFRFHYNPTNITFGTSYVDQGVDPGAITSGADASYPMGDESQSSTVSLSLILNRIDDLSVIQYDGSTARITPSSLYGGQTLDQQQLISIATRGTMYDLEYLFRTVTGRPVMTEFRGMTADHGIIYGVPVILHLGPRMTYWGLVRSIGYNHEYFNENMTPMVTSVSISFQRMPDWTALTDVQGASQQEDEEE